jgi:hypothetical protein
VSGRTYAITLAITTTLGAQSAWTGLSPAGRSPQVTTSSLCLQPAQAQDLGLQDGGLPIRTSIQVMNVGNRPFKVLAPAPGGIFKVRVQFPAAGELEMAPGQALLLPVEYDARLDGGPTDFEVDLPCTDPELPILRQSFHLDVTRALGVRPYRDCLQGNLAEPTAAKPLPLTFLSDGRARFQSASIEDEAAPLLVTGKACADGNFVGQIQLDFTRIQDGRSPKQGETRIFGLTDSGRSTYAWIQWRVQ